MKLILIANDEAGEPREITIPQTLQDANWSDVEEVFNQYGITVERKVA